MSVSALAVTKRLLRDLGVVSLDPAVPANQVVPIEVGDLDDVALTITAALQEIFDDGPADLAQHPGGAYLHGPTAVTLTATEGSKIISALTTYAAWMIGCTIRIDGETSDNELVNSTTLARHYTGATGSSKSATVYGDAVVLDETIQHVKEPLFVAGQGSCGPLFLAQGDEVLSGSGGSAIYLGFNTRKTISDQPDVWRLDGFYNSGLGYAQKRLRFAPMPSSPLSVGYSAILNPPRLTSIQLATSDVTVTGSSAAGTYVAQGSFGGGALYIKTTEDFFLFYDVTTPSWYIADAPSAGLAQVYWQPASSPSVLSPPDASYAPMSGQGGANAVVVSNALEIPIPNSWTESILIPVARQLLTGVATFKNASAVPEIARAYAKAKYRLANSGTSKGALYAVYL